MKKPRDQNPGIGPGRTGDKPSQAPPRVQDPKETAQDEYPQVTPKEFLKKEKTGSKAPLQAAKGNDEVMSQPPRTQP